MKAKPRVKRRWKAFPAMFVLLACPVFAHEMTERHIPVGAYPHLKSEYLTAGTIVEVDDDARTLTLDVDGDERRFHLTGATEIWLDRSRFGQTTRDGDLEDLATGLKAEVRSLGPKRRDVAFWVKVQVPAP